MNLNEALKYIHTKNRTGSKGSQLSKWRNNDNDRSRSKSGHAQHQIQFRDASPMLNKAPSRNATGLLKHSEEGQLALSGKASNHKNY